MKKSVLVLKSLALMLCLGILASTLQGVAFAQTAPITIMLDGRQLVTDVAPIIVSGRTLVPMRAIFEALGASLAWAEPTQTVTARKGATTITLVINRPTATVNVQSVALDQPAQILRGRTLVPLRFVAETLGAEVSWDESRNRVVVTNTAASRRRSPVAADLRLTTGGATFPFPLYTRLMAEYRNITSPAVSIDYASVGSGAGIRGILARTFDFAGTDAPLTDAQLRDVSPNSILHIPTVMGAVAVTYNLPGIGNGLRLTPDVLADIYLGRITQWAHPRIAALNPGIAFPGIPMTVVRRSDASGTTFIFTDYLARVSDTWRTAVGVGTSVAWPGTTVGARGNEGVSAQVSQVPGSIGYVELSNAILNNLHVAHLRNRAGNFVPPTPEGATAAAAGLVANMPADMRASLVDSPDPAAYPIVGLTWILVYRDQADEAKARATVDFLRWAVAERNLEPFAAELHYAPLPEAVLQRVRQMLRTVNHNGVVVWP